MVFLFPPEDILATRRNHPLVAASSDDTSLIWIHASLLSRCQSSVGSIVPADLEMFHAMLLEHAIQCNIGCTLYNIVPFAAIFTRTCACMCTYTVHGVSSLSLLCRDGVDSQEVPPLREGEGDHPTKDDPSTCWRWYVLICSCAMHVARLYNYVVDCM